jgi:ABC-type branched-subunit amino acid transport system substrate-binding protein
MQTRHSMQVAAVGVALAMTAAACGSSTSSSTAAGGTSAAPGSGKRPSVSVAFLAPLTSGNSTFAVQMQNAAKLAVSGYNSSSGGKCTISLTSFDDQGSAETTTQVVNRAVTTGGINVAYGHQGRDVHLQDDGCAR